MMLYNYTYDYSMLSYLEYPILLVQEYILIGLVLHHKHCIDKNTLYFVGGYAACVLLFMYQIMPRFLLSMAVPFCTPVGATSKVIQLLEILRAQDSTTVSLTTWFLSAFTNLSMPTFVGSARLNMYVASAHSELSFFFQLAFTPFPLNPATGCCC